MFTFGRFWDKNKTMNTEDHRKYIENCKMLARRLFKSRHEVKDDWWFTHRRRADIRALIGVVREG